MTAKTYKPLPMLSVAKPTESFLRKPHHWVRYIVAYNIWWFNYCDS